MGVTSAGRAPEVAPRGGLLAVTPSLVTLAEPFLSAVATNVAASAAAAGAGGLARLLSGSGGEARKACRRALHQALYDAAPDLDARRHAWAYDVLAEAPADDEVPEQVIEPGRRLGPAETLAEGLAAALRPGLAPDLAEAGVDLAHVLEAFGAALWEELRRAAANPKSALGAAVDRHEHDEVVAGIVSILDRIEASASRGAGAPDPGGGHRLPSTTGTETPLEVFVSSQMRGDVLAEERRAARDVIAGLGIFRTWAWEDHAPPGTDSAEEACVERAAGSAGLVLILAGSLTRIAEREYRAAADRGRACLVLLKDGAAHDDEVKRFVAAEAHRADTVRFANVSELRTHIVGTFRGHAIRSWRSARPAGAGPALVPPGLWLPTRRSR